MRFSDDITYYVNIIGKFLGKCLTSLNFISGRNAESGLPNLFNISFRIGTDQKETKKLFTQPLMNIYIKLEKQLW